MRNTVVAGLMGVMMAVVAVNVAADSRARRPSACLRRRSPPSHAGGARRKQILGEARVQ